MLDRKPTNSLMEIESQVSDLIKDILQIGHIKATKNFFEMGADSVHLTRLAARLHSRTGQRLSLIELFKYPTVRDLSRYIADSR